ncbi:MAG TPA: carbohydrate binding domain-containing protein [Candidatus Aquilonibacter sp.]|nr:carbohydrate binding domain-containing protein [Candidatus Aquilonibacter sp.]
MEIALNSPPRKTAAIAVTMVLALLYLFSAARFFVASIFAARADLLSLRRAIRFDPGNSDYRDRLGRYYSMVAREPDLAIQPYRTAVKINPHSAGYWFDLASAYQVLGDISNQSWALQHAVEADPTTPDVAWEAANFYLVQGDDEKALREFRVVLENDPSLADFAMQYCWRIKPDADALLKDVVPHKPGALLAFMDLLMAKEQLAATRKVWGALISNPEEFPLSRVYDYFNFLINHQDVEEARLVWQQTASRFGLSSYLPTKENLIVNGDFHLDVLNGGFDWHYQKQASVSLTLDPSDFHGGHRSLLISFDGPGVTDAGIRQYIAVQPVTKYDFSAYYKHGEIEGAGAPHFTIEDAYTQNVLYDSDELKEAGFWKSATGEFVTGSDCRLLLLHVRRIPEGSPIRGKLWVDDFRLVAETE